MHQILTPKTPRTKDWVSPFDSYFCAIPYREIRISNKIKSRMDKPTEIIAELQLWASFWTNTTFHPGQPVFISNN